MRHGPPAPARSTPAGPRRGPVWAAWRQRVAVWAALSLGFGSLLSPRLGGAALAVGLAALLPACAPQVFAPALTGMSPRYGYNGEDTPVTISGADLDPQLHAISGDEIDLGVDFELLLVNEALGPPVPLRGLERSDGDGLQAWVPAGATPGTYDLALRRSGGGDRLADAFTVTDTRADHIEVRTPDLSLAVRDSARVDLQVVDPNGDDVALPVDVVVRAERLDGSVGGVWFEGGLVGQERLGDGRIAGALSASGKATLRLSSEEVTQLRVGVEGVDGGAFLSGLGAWINFEAGSLGGVLIAIEPQAEGVIAGDAQRVRLVLVDAFGNPTRGESAWLNLHETCPASGRGYEDFVRVDDVLVLEDVIITGATDPLGCPGNQLRAFGSAGAESLVGLSAPFEVQAGPLSRLQVEAALAEVIAGRQVQPLWIEALDAFGNTVPEVEGALRLSDSVGGLDSEAGVGGTSCTAFVDGVAACDAVLLRAALDVQVRVEVDDAAGESDPFDVVADLPQALEARVDAGPVRAGEPFSLRLAFRDAFDNPVLPTEAMLLSAVITDGTPALRCAPSGDPALGTLDCTTALARAGAQLWVELPSLSLSAATDNFDVINGDLALIDLQLDGAGPLVAGERIGLRLQGYDGFANPYAVGPPVTVSLFLSVGGLSLGSALLDPSGGAELNPQIVGAAAAQAIVATVSGVERGRSAGFEVVAAPWTRLEVGLPQGWIALGEPLNVTVRATDVFGNTCTSVEGPVSLRSLGGLAPAVAGDLAAGEAGLTLRFEQPGLGDRLRAESGGLLADSADLDVIQLDCAVGPSAALALDGQDELRLCKVGGSTPVVSMSAAASTAGDAPIDAWHFDAGDGQWVRAESAFQSASWDAAGAYLVRVVVADADGCGALGQARAWVGAADGQPVGPVTLGASRSALSVESASTATTILTVEAVDCLGDPAALASVLVDADLGVLSGLSAPLTAPGDGLRLALDADGRGALSLDVLGAPGGADATVRVGLSSGAAFGALTLPLTGDTLAPTVLEVSPAGRTLAPATEVSVRFSEPIWPASVTAARASLLDAAGSPLALSALRLEDGGRLLRLVPDAPLPMISTTWTLFLSGDLRDEAGSRLNGDGTGPRTDLQLRFGDLINAAPALLSCSVSSDRFQPDGDPGPGALADAVGLSAAAAAAPDRWRLSVWDSDGALVRVVDGIGLGATARLEWSGADAAGRVQPPGDYLLELVALDEDWSASVACEALVELRAPFPSPPGWPE